MLIFGLSVALIGVCVVLFALVFLMGVIKAISIFTAITERTSVIEEKGGGKSPVMHVITHQVQVENNGEIHAVIAAALTAFLNKK